MMILISRQFSFFFYSFIEKEYIHIIGKYYARINIFETLVDLRNFMLILRKWNSSLYKLRLLKYSF